MGLTFSTKDIDKKILLHMIILFEYLGAKIDVTKFRSILSVISLVWIKLLV